MMVMTAKLNLKKILLILAAAAAVVLSLILLMGGEPEAAAPAVQGNQARVQFLRDFGWEVSQEPTESSQVKIPKSASQLYERYNNLQKSQGYDLTQYAGRKVLRYVYQISNYPGSTAPVYATLLVCDGQIIGGDITDTGAGGKIRGFRRNIPAEQKPAVQPTVPATVPTETASPSTVPELTH